MSLFSIVCWDLVAALYFRCEDLKTVFAVIFTGKRYDAGFGVWLHSEKRTGGDLKGYFHIIVFELFFSEAGEDRFGVVKLEKVFEEEEFINGIHESRKNYMREVWKEMTWARLV